MNGKYSDFRYLNVSVRDGIAHVVITRPGYDDRGHWEMGAIWRELDKDPDVMCSLLSWADPPTTLASKGPTLPRPEDTSVVERYEVFEQRFREARDAVYNFINAEKPVVSAVRGPIRIGAGFAATLLADISVASESVVFREMHLDMGIVAGDFPTFWPLMCGLPKAKLYIMGGDPISGAEAARIGLVSLAVPDDQVMVVATRYAIRLAGGAKHAIRYTKRALNQYLRQGALTSFDFSLAMEQLSFFSGDHDAVIHAPGSEEEALSKKVEYPSAKVFVKPPQ